MTIGDHALVQRTLMVAINRGLTGYEQSMLTVGMHARAALAQMRHELREIDDRRLWAEKRHTEGVIKVAVTRRQYPVRVVDAVARQGQKAA